MIDTIEIIFKGERKELYTNPQQFPFQVGDYAIVEADKGEDLGKGITHKILKDIEISEKEFKSWLQ